MEEVKLIHLKNFLKWTGLRVGDLLGNLKDWETKIRRCYAEPVPHNSDDLSEMILIDACFIIDLCVEDDLFLKPWLLVDVMRDLLLLENQLPFFVLEEIYNQAKATPENPSTLPHSFLEFAVDSFDILNGQKIEAESMPSSPLHFTDLVRTFHLPPSSSVHRKLLKNGEETVMRLYSASQLSEAGLVFKHSPGKCMLDLEFDEGVLEMPCIQFDDYTELAIRNIMALEQCHYPLTAYISEYIWILDFLINTENDVDLLIDKKIIVNLLGDSDVVATMVNNLCNGIFLPHMNSHYRFLCHQLNGFYENPRNKYKAIFIHDYLNTPWKIASTIAAVVLLVLTLIQTVCSIISLFV